VNRRRIRASLDRLKSQTPPLAQVSLDLGFSSQSHFTRIFSGVMGISPAKFRRQYRPTRG
jgi:AraC-like DNA-binding protein